MILLAQGSPTVFSSPHLSQPLVFFFHTPVQTQQLFWSCPTFLFFPTYFTFIDPYTKCSTALKSQVKLSYSLPPFVCVSLGVTKYVGMQNSRTSLQLNGERGQSGYIHYHWERNTLISTHVLVLLIDNWVGRDSTAATRSPFGGVDVLLKNGSNKKAMASVTIMLRVRVSPRVYITLCAPQPKGHGIPNRATAKAKRRVQTSTFRRLCQD